MRRLHVALTSQLSIMGAHRKAFFKMEPQHKNVCEALE